MKPLVSIVLPTYNGEAYIREALESCLAQTYERFELLVVDDGSTDASADIVRELAANDPRIRLLSQGTNKKLPAALNRGFAEAKGELLTFTSDDNVLKPEALAEMVAYLQIHPDIDLVYCNFSLIDETGAFLREGWSAPIDRLPFSCVVGPCFLFRRSVHERLHGFREDLFLAEDYDFWLRASKEFRFGWLRKDLYSYRWHVDSLTQTQPQGVRRASDETLARNLPHMTWLPRGVRRDAYRQLVASTLARGDRRRARTHVLQALRRGILAVGRGDHPSAGAVFLPDRAQGWVRKRELKRWNRMLGSVARDIRRHVPPEAVLLLADPDQLGRSFDLACAVRPFPESGGHFAGPPASGQDAAQELVRSLDGGASYIAFARPSFWWLDVYSELRRYLEANCHRVLMNDRVIIYDLRLRPKHPSPSATTR